MFVFAQQWKNKGIVASTGKRVSHKDLLLKLLQAMRLPQKVAVCKCAAHTKGREDVTMANRKAGETAKQAAEKP